MSRPVDKTIAVQIDILVATCDKLSLDASRAPSELGHDRIAELSESAARGAELARRLYGPDSHYATSIRRLASNQLFSTMHSNYFGHVSELAGLLRGMQADLAAGMLADVRQLLRAEVLPISSLWSLR